MMTLLGAATTNVRKVTIALAELGQPHKEQRISLERKEQKESWFANMAPNTKVPVLKDGDLIVWESGAILMYLAEHYDTEHRILAAGGRSRIEALQWTFFQAAHIGPNLGRLNDQLVASEDQRIPGMMELFMDESMRLAAVLELHFADGREYLAGDYSIADIMHYPWLKAAIDMQVPALLEKTALVSWIERVSARPGVQQGMKSFS